MQELKDQIAMLRLWADRRIALVRANPDHGGGTIEWVIIIAIVVVLVIAIGAVVASKAREKVDSINLQ